MVATLAAFPARSPPRPHAGAAASCRYKRGHREKTPLYKIVSRVSRELARGSLGPRAARRGGDEDFSG
jgi:hypothetical protein